jgi:hypothetical protein
MRRNEVAPFADTGVNASEQVSSAGAFFMPTQHLRSPQPSQEARNRVIFPIINDACHALPLPGPSPAISHFGAIEDPYERIHQ